MKSLKELRIHLSPSSPGSQGLKYIPFHIFNYIKTNRSFILKNYSQIKSKHPSLPILIRESETVEARIFARFGKSNSYLVII